LVLFSPVPQVRARSLGANLGALCAIEKLTNLVILIQVDCELSVLTLIASLGQDDVVLSTFSRSSASMRSSRGVAGSAKASTSSTVFT
jgi:hypothetical protein